VDGEPMSDAPRMILQKLTGKKLAAEPKEAR
jgi:hypothetical protein